MQKSCLFESLEARRLLSSNAAISGVLFEDLTGNGISPDDQVLSGRLVRLFRDSNGSGHFEAGVDVQVSQQATLPNGRYDFRQLTPGTYFVQQDLPAGWAQSTPAEHRHDHIITPAEATHAPRERNDTLATAVNTGLSSSDPGSYIARGVIGDNTRIANSLDVDFYRVHVNAGDLLRADVDAAGFQSPLDAVLRIFDSAGIQVAGNDDAIGDDADPYVEYLAKTTGTYYVGVSGFANVQYNPHVEGSGVEFLSFNTGPYTIELQVGPRPGARAAKVVLANNERRSDVHLASSRLGSIQGQVFEDLNGDGVQDAAEPGLDGWLVVLQHEGVNFSFTTTRSIDLNGDGTIDPATERGLYSFEDLRPGTYFTRTLIGFGVNPAGVIQTSPVYDPTIRQGIGVVQTGAPEPDPGLGLLPDLTVELERGLFDWFVTGDMLHFGQSTPNIGLGPMELRAGPELGNGTQVVFQRIYQNPQLTSWIDREAGTFIFHPEHNHIHFNSFAQFSVRQALPDADGDGLPEVGPILRGGIKTSFCLVDVAPYDLTLPNASPTPSGFGCGEVQRISVGWTDIYDSLTPGQQINIAGLAHGEYWLEVVVDPDNFLAESNENNNIGRSLITLGPGVANAPAGAHGLPIASGQTAADIDFANFRPINISGLVFNDRNGDGIKQNNEHGLEGFVVFIDSNGDGVLNNPEGDGIPSALATERWAISDRHGNYIFNGVGPGTHAVRQIARPGWVQTTSNPPAIAARSGQNVAGILFGNFQSAGSTASSSTSPAGTFTDQLIRQVLDDLLESN